MILSNPRYASGPPDEPGQAVHEITVTHDVTEITVQDTTGAPVVGFAATTFGEKVRVLEGLSNSCAETRRTRGDYFGPRPH